MTKPVIVNRATKGTPLTTAEHDQNFTNLQNATVGLQAGTGGTTVTADLNGVITLVAGSGVTLSGNNTAKTITLTASGAANLVADTIPLGESDNDMLYLTPPSGYALKPLTITFNGVTLNNPGGANILRGASDGLTLSAGDPLDPETAIVMDPPIGQLAVRADGTISLESPLTSVNGVFNFKSYTTTQRNALTVGNGAVIYNSTKDVVEFYSSSWAELGNKRSVRPSAENTTIVNADISGGWVFKDLFTYSISYTNYTATNNGNIELPSDISQIGRLYTLHINKSGTAVVGFGVQGVFVSGQSIASGETGTFTYDIEYLGFNQWRLTRV